MLQLKGTLDLKIKSREQSKTEFTGTTIDTCPFSFQSTIYLPIQTEPMQNMVGFATKLLLLAAISPSLDARKLLRSRHLGGVEKVSPQQHRETEEYNADDSTQLELFNEEFFEITFASEETGEKTIIIEREDVNSDPTVC